MINQEIANHIFLHIDRCWDYCYPTGQALETALARGLEPFYDVEQLGSPGTITDVKINTVSIDAKGSKTLKLLDKIDARTNTVDYNMIPVSLNNTQIYLSVPKTITTQVRRPKVDLRGYRGDPEKILTEQIDEYQNFVHLTSKSDGCDSIVSFVVQYIEKQNLRSATLTVNEFNIPEAVGYSTKTNKEGKNTGYVAVDSQGNEVFSLSSFNAGSSNMYKRFSTENFYYRVWEAEPYVAEYNRDRVEQELSETGIVGHYQQNS